MTYFKLFNIGDTTVYTEPNRSMHLMKQHDDGTYVGVTFRRTPADIAAWFQEYGYALSYMIEYNGRVMTVNMFVTIYGQQGDSQ